MGNEILKICTEYYERQLGVSMSPEMKEGIVNIGNIATKLNFYLSIYSF